MNDDERKKLTEYYEQEKEKHKQLSNFSRFVSASFITTFALVMDGGSDSLITSLLVWILLSVIVYSLITAIEMGVHDYFEATEKFFSLKNIWILICANGIAYFISSYLFR